MEMGLDTRQYISKRIFAMLQGPVYYPDDEKQMNPIMGDSLCLGWFGRKLGLVNPVAGEDASAELANLSKSSRTCKGRDTTQFIDAKEYGERK